jgi:electron transfer flavoprotein beta subunit
MECHMKILVCVKQVPEIEQALSIDESAIRIIVDDPDAFRMNRFDAHAVEEAIAIKQTIGNTTVDIITVGPERAAMVVRRAMGMGADNGIHIHTYQNGYLDPFVIAAWIASYVKHHIYDLIFTGVMSEDDMQGQVGPLVAEFLDWPCATAVIYQRVRSQAQTLYVEREIEGGARDMLELHFPAVLTIQSGINQPRYPSLSNLLRAKREKIKTIEAVSLEKPRPRQKRVRLAFPQRSRSGLVLKGTQKEKALQLLQILQEKAFIE